MTNEAPAEVSLQQRIIEWVEEQIGMGDEHSDAFEVTAERIVCEGFSEDFVREFSKSVVRDLYQSRNRQHRKAALEGHRRVDIEQLQSDESLLDTIWYVDGEAVRLGDFTKGICQKAQGEFSKKARAIIQDVNFLDRLNHGLKGKATVRSAFTDDQLRALWESSQVMD